MESRSVGNETPFLEELAAINRDLTDSLTRLELLLARKRSELAATASQADRAGIERTIAALEAKLLEIKQIGQIGIG